MQTVTPPGDTAQPHWDASRRPGAIDLAAGVMLLITVALHIAALFPGYFGGRGLGASAWSQPDQATEILVLAAGWALALAIGLTGPGRMPVGAGLATGLALTELGFRLQDWGSVFAPGPIKAGVGLWLISAGWVVGLVASITAVLAAILRSGPRRGAVPAAAAAATPPPVVIEAYLPASEAVPIEHSWAPPMGSVVPVTPVTPATPAPSGLPHPNAGPTTPATPRRGPDHLKWTALVAVLGLAMAGFYLAPWVRYEGVSTEGAKTIIKASGNGFGGAWEIIVGNVVAAVALLIVPVLAVQFRSRAAAAGAVAGSVIVLGSQLASAVALVDRPPNPLNLGITANQYLQLGYVVTVRLNSWFTLDCLSALALLAVAAFWVLGRVEEPQENSAGVRPSAPDLRSEAIPWLS